jgi:Protein of unknown function (DUF4239)
MESFINGVIHFDMDLFAVGAFYISLFVVLSAMGQVLVKKMMGTETIALCHEVGGYYMSIVGSMYAVVLGLVIFDAITNFQDASMAVKDEAKALLAVYSLADQFEGKGKQQVKALAADYAKEVVENEWRMMDQGDFSPKARALMWNLLDQVKQLDPRSENQRVVLPILINETLMAWSARRARIEKIGLGIPELEWFTLLAGAVITILFTYFFTIAIGTVQLLMTGMVAFMLAINLYMVLMFGNPYSGDLRIPATAFEVLNQYMHSHLSFMDGAEKGAIEEAISTAPDFGLAGKVILR